MFLMGCYCKLLEKVIFFNNSPKRVASNIVNGDFLQLSVSYL